MLTPAAWTKLLRTSPLFQTLDDIFQDLDRKSFFYMVDVHAFFGFAVRLRPMMS